MFTAELAENVESGVGLCTLCELGGEFCLQRRKGKGGTIRQNEKSFLKLRMALVIVMFMMSLVPSTSAEAIIIDHNCTNLSKIPADWINQSQAMFNLSYGHTSHGSQIVTGMNVIKAPAGSLYWWYHDGTQGGLSLYDSTPSGDLGNPDRTTWATQTRAMLDGQGNDRNMVMWSWYGQVDTNETNMQI